MGTGDWDLWFADMVLYSSDGTVIPIMYRQSPISPQLYEVANETNYSVGIDSMTVPAGDPSAQNTVAYTLSDHLGTAQMTFSGGGWPVWKGEFSPFGQELDTQYTPNNFKFTGKERDAESGNDYFGARYYGSSMGRFMSPDPLGGHLEDPQTLNKYSYVANNPLTRTDPTGMDFNLQCTQTKNNASTCQGGVQGTTTTDANGKSTFTATRISSDDKGNLTDQNGNKYSGTFDGKNVSFTGADGSKSNGSWIQGSNKTDGITGSGPLSNNFNFTFYNHGANQMLNFTFTYSGSMTRAFGELQNAGFTHWNTGGDIGFSEWRTDVAGRNSSHFLVWNPNWLEQHTLSPPSTLPQGPGTKGEGHVGEYYPGFHHTVCDVAGLC